MQNFDGLTELELLAALSINIDFYNQYLPLTSDELYIRFTKLHSLLFKDSHKFDLEYQAPKREEKLRTIFQQLEWQLPLYPIKAIAKFYNSIIPFKPFLYGNNLTVRIFIYSLGKHLNIDFDFRILTKNQIKNLINNKKIETVLLFISYKHNKNLPPKVKSFWPDWPDASYTDKGRKFLCFKQKYLVAIDGSLFPLKKLDQLRDKSYIDSTKYPKKLLSLYKNKHHIDGIIFNKKKIPLINLNQDVLTGLNIDTELITLFHTIHKNNISILELPDKLKSLKQVIKPDTYKIIVKAAKRLKDTRKLIYKLAKLSFMNKRVIKEPTFFVTMGGSGSGKGILKNIAEELSNFNLVEASLDKSRYHSFIYKLLVACEHHNDDYRIITQFAHALRDAILNYALSNGYNLLFDGSGIPYRGRYEHLIEIFKNSGYKTYVLAAEAPFYSPKKSRIGIDSYKRIIKRFQGKKDHRALPWSVAIEKHALQPRAQLDASHDTNLTSLIIYDTFPQEKDIRVLAFTKNISEKALHELLDAKHRANKLKKVMLKYQLLPKNLKLVATNLDFLVTAKISKDIYKILIIKNRKRFIESMQKKLLNTESKGKEDIFFNNLKYLIPSIDLKFRL